MKRLLNISQLTILGGLIALIAGCHSNPPTEVENQQNTAKTSPSNQYIRPLNDGVPWWNVDVTKIPDAVPIPHQGVYKKNPYTVLGKTYYPKDTAKGYKETGTASWYGTKFHGQATANGELYDLYGMTAAHKTLPLPSYVKVTNLDNGRSVILRVNDRGPFHSDRIIDLSFAAAKKLGYANIGTARVRVEGVDPAQWKASQAMAEPRTDQKAQTALASKQQPNPTATSVTTTVKEYNPPINQHATSDIKDPNLQTNQLYLQIGAFANPDAAELLRQRLIQITDKPVFIASVQQGKQQLYRVRLGPLPNQQEMHQIQNAIRIAKLGQATLVKRN